MQHDINHLSVPRLVAIFAEAVRDVFETMIHVKIRFSNPSIKQDFGTAYKTCGIIELNGDLSGSVVVSFSTEAAVKSIECFCGMHFEPGTPAFTDAIGELTNLIVGSAKRHLGGATNISLPSVSVSDGCTVAVNGKQPCVVLPCSSPFGEFTIEARIQPRTSPIFKEQHHEMPLG